MADLLHIPVTAQAAGLGLGLAALGRPAYINVGHEADVGRHPSRSALRQQAHDVLDAAWASGVRYFDAARSYGEAEAFLGSWLTSRSIEPNQVAVGSKWGYRYTADWATDATVHEVKEHSLAMLDRQWPETQAHLGGYLDLYQIHSATLDSGALTDRDVLDGLRRLADTGVAIGLSTSGPAQAATVELALSIQRDDGTLLFDAVQATWNVLEPSAGVALRAAADAGLTVIVKEALANGRLTSHEPELARRLEPLAPGHPPDAIAIAAVLQQP
jgi:aryl-alcohol dehydrogenase-like predicted oxidoreductase